MSRYFTCLIAGLAIVAGACTALSASSFSPYGDVDILVGGTPQRRYSHESRWYVEALKGREYAIRLHNPFPVRVAVALTVDGLNTIDARETTARDGRKWVIEPFQTITISGWQTSRTHARQFEFTTEEQSYGQALGKTANFGVIAAAFFKERVRIYSADAGAGREQREAPAPSAAAPTEQSKSGAESGTRADNEYAATGMGRRTGHAVEQVWMDLDDAAAKTVSIRYEFRPQLVQLGILPPLATVDPLQRRERARGFEPGFAPELPSR